MSDQISHYQSGFDAFPNFDLDQLEHQQSQNLEFLSFHSPCDLVAPPPDIFEFDIDLGLEGFDDQLQLFPVDQSFHIPRGPCGPLSTLTSSGVSESAASDDLFSDVSSFYGPLSANPTQSLDIFSHFEMEFQRVSVGSDYGAPQSKLLEDDPTSFGRLPPTPPRSPQTVEKPFPKGYAVRSSFSDYGPPRRSSLSAEYFSNLDFTSIPQGTVSPLHISAELPSVPSPTVMTSEDEAPKDGRKKYRCSHCPRSFARAYNLKTHMGTHDPNRLKPHVCPHRSCGRSFSRKHDLGRHLVSIHRGDEKKDIGVAVGARTWCDTCGKGSVGPDDKCKCTDDN